MQENAGRSNYQQPPGEYDSWKQLQRIMLTSWDMSDPVSFMSSANFKVGDPRLDAIEMMLILADIQRTAWCSRRQGELAELRDERRTIRSQISEFDDEPDDYEENEEYTDTTLPPLTADTRVLYVERCAAIEARISYVQGTIDRDKKDGCYEDYTEWESLYEEPDETGEKNAAKYNLAPQFLRAVMNLVAYSMHSTRSNRQESLASQIPQFFATGSGGMERYEGFQMAKGAKNRRRPTDE